MTRNLTFGAVWVIIALAIIWGGITLFKGEDAYTEPEEITEEVVKEIVPWHELEVIGQSVEGRDIEVYKFGSGEKQALFVGGIHGGYEWNSVLLAYEFIDYFTEFPNQVPRGTTVSIIPSLNPDGVFKVIQKEGRFTSADVPVEADITLGRFNANDIDLNRNFDCKWQEESTWRGNVVSAGTEAFSEPEAAALRDYVAKINPEFVVFWHSKANAVYASECEEGILPGTYKVLNTYTKASGYKAIDIFDAYEVTGDAEGWLASIGIPAVTVELETRDSTEWAKNLRGVQSVLELEFPEMVEETQATTTEEMIDEENDDTEGDQATSTEEM